MYLKTSLLPRARVQTNPEHETPEEHLCGSEPQSLDSRLSLGELRTDWHHREDDTTTAQGTNDLEMASQQYIRGKILDRRV